MENLLKKIKNLHDQVIKTWELLDIDQKKEKIEDQKLKMNASDFWDDHEEAVRVSKNLESYKKEVGEWENMKKEIIDLEQLVVEGEKEKDDSIEEMVIEQYEKLKSKFEKLEFYILFGGKYDEGGAIISIHAGTGGVDAQDWAQILERMLLRFCEKKNWKVELVERTMGNEAGIKSSMYHITGRWAYGYLQSESGVHRLVRISPFDAEAMRHTSFALVEVIPELPETEEVEIQDNDLRIDVFKSSGPGGQSVNTTDSAIRIKHEPSGIVVTCQNERSQHQNKEAAMKILKSKLFKLEVEKREEEERKIKGEAQKAEWGKQIRSYVLQPYKMVKDHRTNYETQETDKVLDGELEEFMEEYLRWSHNT